MCLGTNGDLRWPIRSLCDRVLHISEEFTDWHYLRYM